MIISRWLAIAAMQLLYCSNKQLHNKHNNLMLNLSLKAY